MSGKGRKKRSKGQNGDTLTAAQRKRNKKKCGRKKNRNRIDEEEEDDGLHGVSSTMDKIIKDAANTTSRSQFTVKLEDVSLDYDGKPLIVESTVTLAFGHRYGLVGPNGSGKSTFMRALGKRQIGKLPPDINMLYVEQEVTGDPVKNAVEMVVEADTERLELLSERDALEEKKKADGDLDTEDQDRLTEVHQILHSIGAHSAEFRARAILTGLQFEPRMQSCPTTELSGGWRMRIALARSLFCRPHILLLDEPSNHLDLHACLWLEGYLRKWKKTLLVVSHDVDMLNYICTDIIELDMHLKKLFQYRGNYEAFRYLKTQRMEKYKVDYKKQQKELNALQKLKEEVNKTGGKKRAGGAKKNDKKQRGGRGDAGGATAQRAKNLKQKEAALAKKDILPPPPKPYSVKFSFDNPGPLPHPVLQVKDVSFAYDYDPQKPDEAAYLFENINIGVDLDSRVAVVGKNGVGKSTLMKLLTKDLDPNVGEVLHAAKLKIATYSQHFEEGLPLDISAAQLLVDKHKLSMGEARRQLGRFGISGAIQMNDIRTLSGGQKARVNFCLIAMEQPDILFLDEPTNHLDIESIEALAEGLRNFKGGVLLITHNQHLISASCDRIWLIEGDCDVEVFDGEFKDYQDKLLDSLVFYGSEDEDETTDGDKKRSEVESMTIAELKIELKKKGLKVKGNKKALVERLLEAS
eukprot:TRINITY_DN7453_c0_g1_i1.p1 TRINITY_DN7453_c0_g1~~TRINITY_DN7453_c0_g1_i1.p1  ORF type:complete len:700 (-),score=165.54 TRINITY_DN7453_c0_g1_i1:103-2178(-)